MAAGDTERGVHLLDEAMNGVTNGDVSAMASGIIYCAVIEACISMFDVRRAAEWTDSLHRWCEAQPDLVPYRGQCLVHRSQVFQASGAWDGAVSEARRARERLADPIHPALGLALYQQAEMYRLRGESAAAYDAYRTASGHGYEPTRGLALLRLENGEVDAAVAMARRMLDEVAAPARRPSMLAAAVEILLAAGDTTAATRASEELLGLAGSVSTPLLRAIAAHASAAVRLATGDATGSLADSRVAGKLWRELGMPYDVARSRVHVALACRALADDATADLELQAAAAIFEDLGARPDLARIIELTTARSESQPGGLTERECEVLRLVATGRTNREVAATLIISEHTVARHVQNIFAKLGVSSRSAATAFAFRRGVV